MSTSGRRHQGDGGDHRQLSGKRSVLARGASRPQAPVTEEGPLTGHWRRRSRLFGGLAGGLPPDPRATLLCEQDRQRAELDVQEHATKGQGADPGHLDGQNPQGCRNSLGLLSQAYGPKYPKAAERLTKDRDVLLNCYGFPAEHWKHSRTTNRIESTFAKIRLRTYRTKGFLYRKTALAMVFRLCRTAQKTEKTGWIKPTRRNHSRR